MGLGGGDGSSVVVVMSLFLFLSPMAPLHVVLINHCDYDFVVSSLRTRAPRLWSLISVSALLAPEMLKHVQKTLRNFRRGESVIMP